MATYTDNYQLTLPTYAEVADIATINNNMTKIDEIMHDSQISIATAYDATRTSANPYNTGDIVMYEKIAYKCKEDGVYGTWDASKWEQTTLADNLGGGDASEISYDNTTSGMTATNVQDAIDELQGEIEDIPIVEANPQGEATEELSKVGINNTIYKILGGEKVYGSASGAIATFTDGGNNKPLKSLKVAINPVQASGTPTPQAPIPISGWSGCNITRCGKNLVDETKIQDNVRLNTSNGATEYALNYYVTDYILIKKGVTYSMNNPNSSRIWSYSINDKTPIEMLSSLPNTFTINYDCYIRITIYGYTTFNLEVNSTTTSYTPYVGTSYPITWSEAGTVYGGTLDVTNGKLKARPYYASYNGETLIGPWVSSMDVYDPNTPPTTGAQVVDLGGVETEIDISPTQITSLLGNNNLWSDTGEIEECVYIRDINLGFNALWDAVMNSNSGTRSLSSLNLSKSATKEETEETKEEPKEEEETKEEQR